MANRKILITRWNADKDADEWLEFDTNEIDGLFEMGIIDADTLGFAMNDQEAFEKAFEAMESADHSFTHAELVNVYIDNTTQEIRIEL